jgi:hypothetical protein
MGRGDRIAGGYRRWGTVYSYAAAVRSIGAPSDPFAGVEPHIHTNTNANTNTNTHTHTHGNAHADAGSSYRACF